MEESIYKQFGSLEIRYMFLSYILLRVTRIFVAAYILAELSS